MLYRSARSSCVVLQLLASYKTYLYSDRLVLCVTVPSLLRRALLWQNVLELNLSRLVTRKMLYCLHAFSLVSSERLRCGFYLV